MVGYDEDFIQSFAERTKSNLEFIERHKHEEGVFEVTQLINSLLGLVVFVKERRQLPNNRREYYRHFRNAIAHGRVTPHTGNQGHVDTFTFWDGNNWKETLDIDTIKEKINELSQYIPTPRG